MQVSVSRAALTGGSEGVGRQEGEAGEEHKEDNVEGEVGKVGSLGVLGPLVLQQAGHQWVLQEIRTGTFNLCRGEGASEGGGRREGEG